MTNCTKRRRKQSELMNEHHRVLQTGDRGTIKPKAGFDAGEDAVALRKAIEGLGRSHTHTHAHTHTEEPFDSNRIKLIKLKI